MPFHNIFQAVILEEWIFEFLPKQELHLRLNTDCPTWGSGGGGGELRGRDFALRKSTTVLQLSVLFPVVGQSLHRVSNFVDCGCVKLDDTFTIALVK